MKSDREPAVYLLWLVLTNTDKLLKNQVFNVHCLYKIMSMFKPFDDIADKKWLNE